MGNSEQDNWARALDGDPSALGRIFDAHHDQLFRAAYRLLSDREDAGDAVTVALWELWRKRHVVRLVDGSPLPWLLTTVQHSARNIERSRRRYRALLRRLPVEESVGPSPLPDESGVIDAMTRLPDGERAVMQLSVIDGHSTSEVSDMLAIPVGTVRSRLFRAKARLRAVYESEARDG
ncbi:RNA polymerase sigma factor [Microbacterium gilvum]|uniref:Sigma-70 family RNA polymerase sigma factor n=1 Tax=Microbacterium gilvum TaxID=1336204 RepID=A0ABP9A1Z1_9MICO